MSKVNVILIVVLALGVTLLVSAAVVSGIFMCYMNKEAILRNTITNKQKDNQSEFDNMWKKIQGVNTDLWRM